MKTHFIRTVVSAVVLAACWNAAADINLAYYSSLDGLSGAQLKSAIHELTGSPDVRTYSYGSGAYSTWWCFYLTDRDAATNRVADRYSTGVFSFGDRGSSVAGMNIEHSFAKSWWGGATVPAYKDLYNLMPCETTINNSKSNYVMGVVVSDVSGNGFTKVGNGPDGFKTWEPADMWKGVFARGYMYMATAYQDYVWAGNGLDALVQGDYPTLKPWASALYIDWARSHPVEPDEVRRNQIVSDLQGNRNPYVDFPNLMEYVWGDSIGRAFEPLTSVKSARFFGIPDGAAEALIDAEYKNGEQGCTVEYAVRPAAISNVWKIDAKYGWKASAATGSGESLRCYDADATMLTPEIDLSERKYAVVSFSHALNYCTVPQQYMSVSVRVSGEDSEMAVDVPVWPNGTSWRFINSGEINLTPFCGKKIRLAFRYTSDTSVAGTWEVESILLTAQGKLSGIETVPVELMPDGADCSMPAEYYSIDGRRVNPENYRGIVIRRQGTKVSKIRL